MRECEYNADESELKSVFNSYRNDINIYTEDTKLDKEFYVTLFNRLIDKTGIRINDVYPLGNSSTVIKACKDNVDTSPHLYIVDGDIHLMNVPKQTITGLHVLGRYCIENYLIDST